jgi:nitrilase
MGPEEGVLYADIDLEIAVRAKLTHDFAGHYNRPDVFQLHLNTTAPQILQRNPMLPNQDPQNMAREVNAHGDSIPCDMTSSGAEEG